MRYAEYEKEYAIAVRNSTRMQRFLISSLAWFCVAAILTMFVVPVLYCSVMEWKLKLGIDDPRFAEDA